MSNTLALERQLYNLNPLGPKELWEKVKSKAGTARGSFELGSRVGFPLGLAYGGASYASIIPYVSTAGSFLGLLGTMGLYSILGMGLFGLAGLGLYGLYKGYRHAKEKIPQLG